MVGSGGRGRERERGETQPNPSSSPVGPMNGEVQWKERRDWERDGGCEWWWGGSVGEESEREREREREEKNSNLADLINGTFKIKYVKKVKATKRK